MPTSQTQTRTADQPCDADAETVRVLTQLRSQYRQGWRCLQALQAFSDFAHLARRLHLSHQSLRELLQQLSAQLGEQHLSVVGGEVRLSREMRQCLAQVRVASSAGESSPAQESTVSNAAPDQQNT